MKRPNSNPISNLAFRKSQRAFTLIEVVISSALMALILVASYICFSASIASRKTMEPRLEVIQNARVAMALITADLRAACPLDKETQFLGMHRTMGDTVADNLDFASHNYAPQRPGEGDFCQLSYYLDRDAETGQLSLWRRRNPTLAPDSLEGGRKEEIATGLLGMQFEYFDGFDWYEEWGDISGRGKQETSQKDQYNLSGMPEAVRITLWFDADPSKKPNPNQDDLDSEDKKAPMMFQTVARLNVVQAQSDNASDSADAAAPEAGGTGQ